MQKFRWLNFFFPSRGSTPTPGLPAVFEEFRSIVKGDLLRVTARVFAALILLGGVFYALYQSASALQLVLASGPLGPGAQALLYGAIALLAGAGMFGVLRVKRPETIETPPTELEDVLSRLVIQFVQGFASGLSRPDPVQTEEK